MTRAKQTERAINFSLFAYLLSSGGEEGGKREKKREGIPVSGEKNGQSCFLFDPPVFFLVVRRRGIEGGEGRTELWRWL